MNRFFSLNIKKHFKKSLLILFLFTFPFAAQSVLAQSSTNQLQTNISLSVETAEQTTDSCNTWGDIIRTHKPANATNTPGNYSARDDVEAFAQRVAECYLLDYEWVINTLRQAQYQPSSTKFIMPQPAGTKNWSTFVSNFVQPDRIQAGVKYWYQNEEWLNLAQNRYGVPPKIILGIIGVETIFGKVTGNFRIIDTLSTLAFDFPTGRSDRSDFFADELAQYLIFTAQQGIDPLSIKGSYAGAMGMPQFMPSSLVSYGVDFDDDGKIDLHNSNADIIGSVANYLAQHGWQSGLPGKFPLLVDASISIQDLEYLRQPDIVPTFTSDILAAHGVQLINKSSPSKLLSDDVKLAFIELENGANKPSIYIAGTQNFFVVTRYNRSSFYAAAVLELADAIEKAYNKVNRQGL